MSWWLVVAAAAGAAHNGLGKAHAHIAPAGRRPTVGLRSAALCCAARRNVTANGAEQTNERTNWSS